MEIKDADKPILIIDSGMGAVIVERKLNKIFPQENTLILMDNEFLPYGLKKEIEIQRRITKLMRKIKSYSPKMIVIACNTIDAIASDRIVFEFPSIPVVQVVYPTAKKAITESKSKKIAVLATKRSIESKAYHYASALYYPNVNVIGVQCDNLAKNIELNEDIKKTYNEEVKPLENEKFDTIILGCTHYSRIKALVNKQYPEKKIIDSTDVIIEQIEEKMKKISKRKQHFTGKTSFLMTKVEEKDYIDKLYQGDIKIELIEI